MPTLLAQIGAAAAMTDSANMRLVVIPDDPNTPHLDPQTALRALVHAQGQPALAAERLGLRSADDLLAVMVLDETIHDQMRQVMRAFLMIRLLGVANTLEQEVLGRLDELDAKETGRLFASIITLADLLTKSTQSNSTVDINVQQTVMRMLPPDVRRAFQIVTSQDPELALETQAPLEADAGG